MQTVSVIVPVYNVKPYLERCLNALNAQTVFHKLEIILVDDGSTDGSGQICEAFAKHRINVKVIHQANAGQSEARNKGIAAAAGEYIAFADADDYMFPDMYETLLRNAKKFDADISIVGFVMKRRSGWTSERYGTGRTCIWEGAQAVKTYLMNRSFEGSACTKLFKSVKYRDLKFVPGRTMSEDKYYVLQALARATTVCFEDVCKYVYERRGGSTTSARFSEQNLNDSLFFIERMQEFVQGHFPEMNDLAACNAAFLKYKTLERLDQNREARKRFAKERTRLYEEIRSTDMKAARRYLSPRHRFALRLMRKLPFVYVAAARILGV